MQDQSGHLHETLSEKIADPRRSAITIIRIGVVLLRHLDSRALGAEGPRAIVPSFAATSNCGIPTCLCFQESAWIGREPIINHPPCDLTVRGVPDIGELREIGEDLLIDRRDHWPAAIVAMHGDRQVAAGLTQVEVIKSFPIDVPQIHRA